MSKPTYYEGEIPFYKDGHQASYADYDITWKQNAPFSDLLTFDRFERGRSAAHAIFTRKNGKEVTVFLADLGGFFPTMVSGKVAGTFVFCKRGQNYGCKLHTGEK